MNTMTLVAIAEPNRLRIVELLRDNPCSVGEIANQLLLRQPQVSKHLRILTDAGWVCVRPQAQKHIYHLQAKPFTELELWLESFKCIWESNYQRLDSLLEEMKNNPLLNQENNQ